MLPGMVGAAEYGTAHRGVDASMGVAGKTGSCIGKGSWVGLFASVAPVEDPKYSVVVITRGQGERGKYAAAIAGQVYQALAFAHHPQFEIDWARRNLKADRSPIPEPPPVPMMMRTILTILRTIRPRSPDRRWTSCHRLQPSRW